MVAFVHDALYFDMHPSDLWALPEFVRHEMEDVPVQVYDWLTVPLVADFEIGTRWGTLGSCQCFGDHIEVELSPDDAQELHAALRLSGVGRLVVAAELDGEMDTYHIRRLGA